jgi:4-amino-4-deoxy-L-arabinose transferase-like glycosyltransferase
MTSTSRPTLAETIKLSGRRRLGWQTLVWAGLTAMVLFLMGLRDHTLWYYHEPYVGGIIREMATSGNWVVPTLNGHAYLEKPPLFYALGALACRTFHTFHPWALRLPSALLAMAAVVWTSFLGWRLSSARAGAWAGFFVATNVIFFQTGHMAVVDMTLTAAVTLSLGLAFLAIAEPPYRTRWVPWFWASLGLTFLAKGVLGPFLVLAPLVAVLALQKDRRLLGDFFRPNWGVAAMFAVVALWVVPLALAGGREYLTEVFVRNTLGRFLDSPHLVPRTGRLGEHAEPFYYYFTDLPANLLPWVGIWAVALAAALPWRRGTHMNTRRTFLPIVFVVDLLLLSLSQAKRTVYILPILPITFVHAAIWLDLQMPKGRARAKSAVMGALWFTVVLTALLCVAFPCLLVLRVGMPLVQGVALGGIFLAMTVAAMVLLRQRRLPRVLDLTMVQWTLALVVFMGVGVPQLDREWRPILVPFRAARELEQQGVRILEGRLTETQLGYASLEFRHILPSASTAEAVRAAMAVPEPVAMLMEPQLFWGEAIKPLGLPVVEVRTEASRSRKLYDRAPALILNARAAELFPPAVWEQDEPHSSK